MRQIFDYQGSAADAIELAQRAATPSDKVRLLCLAQRWIELADRVQIKRRGERCWPSFVNCTAI